jgi:hypothetical protein
VSVGGKDTISLMYSETMSSRIKTVSGFGFGSSPKAYSRFVTVVRVSEGREYCLFGRGFVFGYYVGDGDGLTCRVDEDDCCSWIGCG